MKSLANQANPHVVQTPLNYPADRFDFIATSNLTNHKSQFYWEKSCGGIIKTAVSESE